MSPEPEPSPAQFLFELPKFDMVSHMTVCDAVNSSTHKHLLSFGYITGLNSNDFVVFNHCLQDTY